MNNYKQKWTEFEVQALAYGILRKNLYPKYLIRGEYSFEGCRIDIAIFKAYPDKEPQLALVIEVKKTNLGTSTNQGTRYETLLGVPCIYIRGIDDAYHVLDKVAQFL